MLPGMPEALFLYANQHSVFLSLANVEFWCVPACQVSQGLYLLNIMSTLIMPLERSLPVMSTSVKARNGGEVVQGERGLTGSSTLSHRLS